MQVFAANLTFRGVCKGAYLAYHDCMVSVPVGRELISKGRLLRVSTAVKLPNGGYSQGRKALFHYVSHVEIQLAP